MAKMYTNADRDEILEAFNANVDEVLASDSPVFQEDPRAILEKSIQEGRGRDDLRDFILQRIENLVKSCIPEGAPLPQHTVRLNVVDLEEGKYRVDVTVRPVKASEVTNFTYKSVWTFEKINSRDLFRFFAGVYASIISETLAKRNVNVMNEAIARIASSEDVALPYNVTFVLRSESKASNGAFLNSISDDAVEFLISADDALAAHDYSLFSEVPEVEEDTPEEDVALIEMNAKLIRKVQGVFADLLKSAPRTVDLLQVRPQSIKNLTGITTHKPSTLIRNSFSRDIEGLRESIKKTVTARVEVVHGTDEVPNFIAGVERNGETGEIIVTLSPVDQATLEPVDFDVVKYAESRIS